MKLDFFSLLPEFKPAKYRRCHRTKVLVQVYSELKYCQRRPNQVKKFRVAHMSYCYLLFIRTINHTNLFTIHNFPNKCVYFLLLIEHILVPTRELILRKQWMISGSGRGRAFDEGRPG